MSHPVKIPADIDRDDRVMFGLTARQLALLSGTGTALYLLWTATGAVLPLPVFLAIAVPIVATAGVVALGQRDGVGLDRLLVAAIKHRLAPRRRVAAPEGVRPVPEWLTEHTHDQSRPRRASTTRQDVAAAPLELPAAGITRTGIVDLGRDGLALVAVCGPVNFALRTPAEQDALVAAFGRWLHALSAPVQILVRAHRLDLTPQLQELTDGARSLPHPALEHAARDHANFVSSLAARSDLLRRQILLVLRERTHPAAPTDGLGTGGGLAALRTGLRRRHPDPAPDAAARHAAETRLVRRLTEAADLLGTAGITVTALDAGQATAVLASACDPDTLLPPSAGLAGADEVITTTAATDTGPADQPHTDDPGDPGDPGDFDDEFTEEGDEPWD